MTTTQDDQETARCRALGCDAVLFKPVDPRKFLEETQRLGLELDCAIEITETAAINNLAEATHFIGPLPNGLKARR